MTFVASTNSGGSWAVSFQDVDAAAIDISSYVLDAQVLADAGGPAKTISDGGLVTSVGGTGNGTLTCSLPDGHGLAAGSYPVQVRYHTGDADWKDFHKGILQIGSLGGISAYTAVASFNGSVATVVTVALKGDNGALSTDTATALTMDLLADGEVIWITDKFGGSWWRARDEAEAISGQATTAYTFTDELTIFRTTSLKPLMFDIDLNRDLLKRMDHDQYVDWFMRQKTRDTAQHISIYGDSLTFAFAADSVAGATDQDGVATNFGDGSTFSDWQYDDNIAVVLQARLNAVRATDLTVHNRGYSNDRAYQSYLRHRTPPAAGISLVWLSGLNDTAFASTNGTTPAGIYTDPLYSVAAYTEVLRKFVAREILRGNSVVVMGAPANINGAGSPPWTGTTDAGARLTDAYCTAAHSVADEFGVLYMDVRRDVLGQYYIYDIQSDGTHFHPPGLEVMGERLASLFIGDGWRRIEMVQAGSKLIGHSVGLNLSSEGLVPVTVNVGAGTPGFISANPTAIAIVQNDPVTISFFVETDDLLLYVNGYAENSTVTIKLDGGALQQDYKGAKSAGKPVQDGGAAPLSELARAYTTGKIIDRTSSPYAADDSLFFHVTGRGWHTLTIENGGANSVLLDSLEFVAWETERQARVTELLRLTDATPQNNIRDFTNRDDVLKFEAEPFGVYHVKGTIRFETTAAADMYWYLFGMTNWAAQGRYLNNGSVTESEIGLNTGQLIQGVDGVVQQFSFEAILTADAVDLVTGMDMGVAFTQGTPTAVDTKLLAGSYMHVRRIA